MTVSRNGNSIRLEGRCRLEEAETLLELILAGEEAEVDLTACTAMHAAVAQILIGSGVATIGRPADAFLAEHVLPLLKRPTEAIAADRSPL